MPQGGHTTDITSLAFSEQLSLFASGSSDANVIVWDYEVTQLVSDLFLSHALWLCTVLTSLILTVRVAPARCLSLSLSLSSLARWSTCF